MGRPKKAARVPDSAIVGAGRPVEPEEESQEIEDDEPETPVAAPQAAPKAAPPAPPAAPQPTAGGMSKADVCRAALAEGIETTEEAMSFARTRYGMEIKPSDFTLYKSKEKQKSGAPKGKPGRKPRDSSAEPAVAPARAAQPASDGRFSGGMIGDLAAIKALVEKLGVEEVQQIAKLFG